jgi:hypothetical protein
MWSSGWSSNMAKKIQILQMAKKFQYNYQLTVFQKSLSHVETGPLANHSLLLIHSCLYIVSTPNKLHVTKLVLSVTSGCAV